MPCMLRADVRFLVSQFGPAAAAGYTRSNTGRVSRNCRISPSVNSTINFRVDFHPDEYKLILGYQCAITLSNVRRVKESDEGERRVLLFMATAERPPSAHTFVISVRWPEHIKIPSTTFSSRILYSQSSSDNSAKFMPRRLIISHGRSVNEYRNLNFLGARSGVTIDIQKGRVYLQRIIIAGLANVWDKRRRIRAAGTATMKVPFGKIEYRRAP